MNITEARLEEAIRQAEEFCNWIEQRVPEWSQIENEQPEELTRTVKVLKDSTPSRP